MKITKLIIAILLFHVNYASSQSNCIESCTTSDGSCVTNLKIFADSSFIYTSDCERNQTIEVGELTQLEDTIILNRSDLSFDSFFDSIVFITGTTDIDSIDVFYYDNYGTISFSKRDLITFVDIAQAWVDGSTNVVTNVYASAIDRYSRNLDEYKKTGNFLAKNSFYYSVDQSYLINTDRKLALVMKDFHTWTAVKKYVPIPLNTRLIKVYYSVPMDIISILNFYSVQIKQSGEKETMSCYDQVFMIK